MHIKYSRKSIRSLASRAIMYPYPSRRRRLARPREVAQRPAGGPKKEFSLRRQFRQLTYHGDAHHPRDHPQAARDSPRVVARPPDAPFAARRVSYSREDVFQGLEELYAMGGRMRELACMFGTRLCWTPPHLRADDSEQTA